MRTKYIIGFAFATALASNAFGQAVWSANVATAAPNFLSTGVVKTTTVDSTIHGRGVRPRMTVEGNGSSYLYIPVTAPNASTFGCIGLRGMDNSNLGTIRAEFWRQPRNGNAGPSVLLGSVNSVDAAGDGFQFQMAPFAAVAINYSLFTHYIRVTMTHQNTSTAVTPSVIALDVSLSQYCTVGQ
jgi:hypothetical protein